MQLHALLLQCRSESEREREHKIIAFFRVCSIIVDPLSDISPLALKHEYLEDCHLFRRVWGEIDHSSLQIRYVLIACNEIPSGRVGIPIVVMRIRRAET